MSKGQKGLFNDLATNAMLIIAYQHYEIHNGCHFNICDFVDLGDAEVFEFQITTPDTAKWAHFLYEAGSSGPVVIEIYENAIISAPGSAVPIFNNNRNSDNLSSLIIQTGATLSDNGTIIRKYSFGSTFNPLSTTGGNARSESEIILKQNTTYRIRHISGSDGNSISYCAFWYEHENDGGDSSGN